MESHNLYRVKEEDLDKLIRILTVCFSEDPLYHAPVSYTHLTLPTKA